MEKNFSIKPSILFSVLGIKQIQEDNDQEKEQSKRNSYSKIRGGKNKMTIRYLYLENIS